MVRKLLVKYCTVNRPYFFKYRRKSAILNNKINYQRVLSCSFMKYNLFNFYNELNEHSIFLSTFWRLGLDSRFQTFITYTNISISEI